MASLKVSDLVPGRSGCYSLIIPYQPNAPANNDELLTLFGEYGPVTKVFRTVKYLFVWYQTAHDCWNAYQNLKDSMSARIADDTLPAHLRRQAVVGGKKSPFVDLRSQPLLSVTPEKPFSPSRPRFNSPGAHPRIPFTPRGPRGFAPPPFMHPRGFVPRNQWPPYERMPRGAPPMRMPFRSDVPRYPPPSPFDLQIFDFPHNTTYNELFETFLPYGAVELFVENTFNPNIPTSAVVFFDTEEGMNNAWYEVCGGMEDDELPLQQMEELKLTVNTVAGASATHRQIKVVNKANTNKISNSLDPDVIAKVIQDQSQSRPRIVECEDSNDITSEDFVNQKSYSASQNFSPLNNQPHASSINVQAGRGQRIVSGYNRTDNSQSAPSLTSPNKPGIMSTDVGLTTAAKPSFSVQNSQEHPNVVSKVNSNMSLTEPNFNLHSLSNKVNNSSSKFVDLRQQEKLGNNVHSAVSTDKDRHPGYSSTSQNAKANISSVGFQGSQDVRIKTKNNNANSQKSNNLELPSSVNVSQIQEYSQDSRPQQVVQQKPSIDVSQANVIEKHPIESESHHSSKQPQHAAKQATSQLIQQSANRQLQLSTEQQQQSVAARNLPYEPSSLLLAANLLPANCLSPAAQNTKSSHLQLSNGGASNIVDTVNNTRQPDDYHMSRQYLCLLAEQCCNGQMIHIGELPHQFQAAVSYVPEDETEFCWIQPYYNTDILNSFIVLMQDMADEAAAQRPVGLKTQRCISQFSEIWCRAWIDERLDDNRARIFYIDYGNTEVISLSDVLEVSPKIWYLFPMAVPVHVHGVSAGELKALDNNGIVTVINRGLYGSMLDVEIRIE